MITKRLVDLEIRSMVKHNGAAIKVSQYGMYGINREEFEKFKEILRKAEYK